MTTTISLFDSVPTACAEARQSRDPSHLFTLREQAAEAMKSTRCHAARKDLFELSEQITETLRTLADQEAWGLLADAEDEFRTGSPQKGVRILSKFGPTGPTYLRQAVSKGALRRTYEEWLAQARTAPTTRRVHPVAAPA